MYRIRLLASAHDERRNLPGVIRQRIKKIIEALGEDARPDNSIRTKVLTTNFFTHH